MKRLIIFVLTAFVMSLASVSADDGIPDNCPYPNGQFFASNVFLRVDSGGNVLLFDWETGDMISILNMPEGEQTFIGAWSPNCTYITVSQLVQYVDGIPQYQSMVWNIQTGTMLQQFTDAHRIAHPVNWSDNSDYLLVETHNGTHVWHVPTDTIVQLSPDTDSNILNFIKDSLYWDYDANLLSGTIEGSGTVIYDLHTGQRLTVNS